MRATTAVSPCGRVAITTAGARRCTGAVYTRHPDITSSLLGELGFQGRQARLEFGILFPRAARHVLNGIELLPRDEVQSAESFLHPLTRAFAGLASHSGESARSRVGQLDEIGDQRVFALHGSYVASAADGRKPIARSFELHESPPPRPRRD